MNIRSVIFTGSSPGDQTTSVMKLCEVNENEHILFASCVFTPYVDNNRNWSVYISSGYLYVEVRKYDVASSAYRVYVELIST